MSYVYIRMIFNHLCLPLTQGYWMNNKIGCTSSPTTLIYHLKSHLGKHSILTAHLWVRVLVLLCIDSAVCSSSDIYCQPISDSSLLVGLSCFDKHSNMKWSISDRSIEYNRTKYIWVWQMFLIQNIICWHKKYLVLFWWARLRERVRTRNFAQ